ncbi:MAG: DUF5989 family protein, partial [Desulfatibacillaceae bacterium]|nr:DUF5989 family protein [Desulfatibacillaceae bacterium]
MKENHKDRLPASDKKPEKEENLSLPVEFWEFAKHRKRYWLLPILIVLLLMSFLMVFAG